MVRLATRLAIALCLAAVGCGPDGGGPAVHRDDLAVPVDLGADDAASDDLGGDALDLEPGFDGHNVYGDLGHSDSGVCVPPNVGAMCQQPVDPGAGCIAHEDCGPAGSGNGLDDDCNGLVDDGCVCRVGDVERCFLGPPGKHGIGVCSDGTQTCQGGEFGSWGPCLGSIGPSAETCDALDNDCDGCADDGLCCDNVLACPSSVPDGAPYTDINYDGTGYIKASVTSWSWSIVGGPCDQLFAATTGTPPVQSFTLSGASTAMPTFHPTLSGDYTVTMTATGSDGETYSCKWIQHVTGPGVRFELCWDHTGTAAQGGADLDLHVHKPGSTTNWFSSQSGASATPNSDDCDWRNCNASAYAPVNMMAVPPPNWGDASSPLAECIGTELGSTWQMYLNACANPRLDIDNINTVGKPENTNIDDPKAGDTFRAMVHYFGQDAQPSTKDVEEHPIVNIYCAGRLVASYGQAPNQLQGFNHGAGWNAGQMWRVADVTVQTDASGSTSACTVTPLHPPGTKSGYFITTNDTTY